MREKNNVRLGDSSMPGKGGIFFIVSADYPPLWRLVGCRRPPEIKLDVGVFWGDREPLLRTLKENIENEKKNNTLW